MAEHKHHTSTGIPTTAAQDLGEFTARGEFENLNAEAMTPERVAPEIEAAIREFGGVQGGRKFSSIQQEGPANVPLEGGPDSQRKK